MLFSTNEYSFDIAVEGVFSFTAALEGLTLTMTSERSTEEQIKNGYHEILAKGKLKHIMNNHINPSNKKNKKNLTLFYKSFVKDLDELKDILVDIFHDTDFVSELSTKVDAAIEFLEIGDSKEIRMIRRYADAIGYSPAHRDNEIYAVLIAFTLKKKSEGKYELSINTMFPSKSY